MIQHHDASNSGNHMMRNLHRAERLVTGFLYEFRACLDHMETDIKRNYGKESELWKIYKDGTSRAYDTCPEYAFTYHLRNCAQHCNKVVDGFNGTSGGGISSNVLRLQAEYKEWKQVDKDFMSKVGENIDLVNLFQTAFLAFNDALIPVVQYLLDNQIICDNLLYMRKWGDLLSERYKHDIHCFHIVNVVFKDGSSATKEDMEHGETVVNGTVFEWEMIYGLTNSIVKNGE